MLLKALGVTKTFNKMKVINNFDFTISHGEIISLVGESGTGKTTFMRLLTDLEEADTGTISINGDYLCKMTTEKKTHYTSKKERNRYGNKIGLVFQDYQLFPNLNVIQNCIEAPVQKKLMTIKEATIKAESLLKQMNLLDKKDSYPKTLSGGQQQRAAIARAMMLSPEILCFDEPTSALDRHSSNGVGEMIQKIAATGTGILIVTHDIEFAEKFSTRNISSDTFI
ncbi:amino acid ABC transporter ATP-binding protein [Carnobacterium funditum]|uniref:amino acid ABC transporter ATP-binding protein n=1 Tax=Carnobacterium funditum TaxID=2752 RepID=UPI00055090E3|nr:ATP-binding cassette domain-containing protein [Carnobacterium funditum]